MTKMSSFSTNILLMYPWKLTDAFVRPKGITWLLEVAISSLERGFPLVFFADSHSMVCTGKFKLGKSFNSS